MSDLLVEKARSELELAQAQLDAALRAWDVSVSKLWRTSKALTQAQKRVTHAHQLLRNAVDATPGLNPDWGLRVKHGLQFTQIPDLTEAAFGLSRGSSWPVTRQPRGDGANPSPKPVTTAPCRRNPSR